VRRSDLQLEVTSITTSKVHSRLDSSGNIEYLQIHCLPPPGFPLGITTATAQILEWVISFLCAFRDILSQMCAIRNEVNDL